MQRFYPPELPKGVRVQHIKVDANKCIGCEACNDACKTHRAHRNQTVIFIGKVSRYKHGGITCFQCPDAPCISACPVKAIKRTPRGVTLSPDPAYCVFCGLCETACPYGVIVMDDAKNLAVKCDTCQYRRDEGLKPLCISVCPTDAITLESFTG